MSTVKANAYLDAAGGNTATINGILPIAIGDVPAGGSLTLLGTIATTSGTSVTLSGLTLTSYKQLQCVIDSLSGTATVIAYLLLNGNRVARTTIYAQNDYHMGAVYIDLATGVFWAPVGYVAPTVPNYGGSVYGNASGLSTASTSITFTVDVGAFDAGQIKIYGVK